LVVLAAIFVMGLATLVASPSTAEAIIATIVLLLAALAVLTARRR